MTVSVMVKARDAGLALPAGGAALSPWANLEHTGASMTSREGVDPTNTKAALEDETGICNAIIDPDLYEQNRSLVTYGKILLIEGILQNIDKVVHVRMHQVAELTIDAQLTLKSYDFH